MVITISPCFNFFFFLLYSISSTAPKGNELSLSTSTSSYLLINVATAPAFITESSPVYKSIIDISNVANFSSSLNFIFIIELIAFTAFSSS